MKLFKSVGLATAMFALLLTGNAYALTYDLSLNPTIGSEAGTGTLTISGPVANSGISTFTEGGGLTSLNFSIGGGNFTLANDLFNASVTFNNGSLISILYVGLSNGISMSLGTFGMNYAFTDLFNSNQNSIGSISATPVAATPLPSTWGMMILGLGVLGFMGYRRKRSHGVLATA
jgi:PEP-CTERM motif